MSNGSAKRLVLRALQPEPEFSGLGALPPCTSRNGLKFLKWLDESGLALNFLMSIRAPEASASVPAGWLDALEKRMERNAIRLSDMLGEFQRLNDAFRTQGLRVVTMKGFSLIPDFCVHPGARHQTDFDFLVDPDEVAPTAEVLQSFGYSTLNLSRTEESAFMTPLLHTPARKDDIYALQRHRQVDLHVSVTESSPWVDLEIPADCLRYSIPCNLRGVEFVALSLPDRFLAQVFHAFRHSFHSWLRLSWLLEIGRCMEFHRADEALWESVIARAGKSPATQRLFAYILSLTNRLFQSRIPAGVLSWTSPAMTPSMRAWLDHFALEWAISDWPGNLSNLFLAAEFIPEKKLRKRYFASRLLPKRVRLSIETMASEEKKQSVAWNLQRWQYLAHRSRIHLKDMVCLPLGQLRWKRALDAAEHKLSGSES
jgi:Uncharacterised nucleotidyltransferase